MSSLSEYSDQSNRILDRIELRFGIDSDLRSRLHPVVAKVLALGEREERRKDLLRLVAEAYAHHIRAREVIEDLDQALRERINSQFAETLGIQPPNLNPE